MKCTRYVKAMVKVDWQLWVITSNNIKIWTAASLWNGSNNKLSKYKEIDSLRQELIEARLAVENFKVICTRF